MAVATWKNTMDIISYRFPYSKWFFYEYIIEWMNEWMMHLYSALLCIAVHPKRLVFDLKSKSFIIYLESYELYRARRH